MTLRNAAASGVGLMDELSAGRYAPWRTPGGAAVAGATDGDKAACPLAMRSQFGRSACVRLDSRRCCQPPVSGSASDTGDEAESAITGNVSDIQVSA
jgi:hypothetical protein